jgi:hypothetical protein
VDIKNLVDFIKDEGFFKPHQIFHTKRRICAYVAFPKLKLLSVGDNSVTKKMPKMQYVVYAQWNTGKFSYQDKDTIWWKKVRDQPFSSLENARKFIDGV